MAVVRLKRCYYCGTQGTADALEAHMGKHVNPWRATFTPVVEAEFQPDGTVVFTFDWYDSAKEAYGEDGLPLTPDVLQAASLLADEFVKSLPPSMMFEPSKPWGEYLDEAGV